MMKQEGNIQEYIASLLSAKRMAHQVAFHKILPERPMRTADTEKPLPALIRQMMHQEGAQALYRHQAEAIDLIRSDRHVVVATPTASGKTLIYNIPVMERIIRNPSAKALYVFPLKALAQDQLRNFETHADSLTEYRPTAAIYDGDTTAWHRKKIRRAPPNVLLTNPEMIHLSVLPHHDKWAEFLSGLQVVVIDEVHTYRGVMGSHMAQVFRRLRRACAYYGTSPVFVFSSATIANPAQLARQLTGLDVRVVSESGAPRGKRHLVILNPDQGPVQAAILLLKAALFRNLRTIVYTQSRKLTELLAIWAGSQSGPYKNRISAYRAGFLPEERRGIEKQLTSGELLAVISTSALELGIDIGDLDLCILVGYPGSVMATWQRGGRVGRSGQESALALIAGEDALDQYFVRHPKEFITKGPEAAVINPHNEHILKQHLACAAAEFPLDRDEPFVSEPTVQRAVHALERSGDLLKSADGKKYFSRLKSPHRHVSLRGTGNRFEIVCSRTGENRGEVDGFRAFRETHPGAVYLHKGTTYLVDHLDLNAMTVKVSPAEVDYYTRVRGEKDTEILDVFKEKTIWGTKLFTGRLKVTDQVTGYEKWRIHAKKKIAAIPLALPPQIFETEGFWIVIPPEVQDSATSQYMHFMGGIHAIEHAMIGITPFFVMTDRNDLGGISIPFHPQLNASGVFVYDSVPGGAGLSRLAFQRAGELLARTLSAIQECPCETGCPGCVHSPKCGSGNRPIDKASAVFILEQLKTAAAFKKDLPVRHPKEKRISATSVGPEASGKTETASERKETPAHYGVLDIETQRSAQEVGGWHKADQMKVSCVVLYDSKTDSFLSFLEHQMRELIEHLKRFDLIVGFNIKRFDYRVLSFYSNLDFSTLHTMDILEKVHERLGYRLSLDHLAAATLGKKKSGDGLQALLWWKQGKIQKIIDYCQMDVKITRDLFLYGKEHGYLLFRNKAGHLVRVPAEW